VEGLLSSVVNATGEVIQRIVDPLGNILQRVLSSTGQVLSQTIVGDGSNFILNSDQSSNSIDNSVIHSE
jgi:hypothetical protein